MDERHLTPGEEAIMAAALRRGAKRLGELHRETVEENDARIAEQGREERAKMDAEMMEKRDGLRQK